MHEVIDKSFFVGILTQDIENVAVLKIKPGSCVDSIDDLTVLSNNNVEKRQIKVVAVQIDRIGNYRINRIINRNCVGILKVFDRSCVSGCTQCKMLVGNKTDAPELTLLYLSFNYGSLLGRIKYVAVGVIFNTVFKISDPHNITVTAVDLAGSFKFNVKLFDILVAGVCDIADESLDLGLVVAQTADNVVCGACDIKVRVILCLFLDHL